VDCWVCLLAYVFVVLFVLVWIAVFIIIRWLSLLEAVSSFGEIV